MKQDPLRQCKILLRQCKILLRQCKIIEFGYSAPSWHGIIISPATTMKTITNATLLALLATIGPLATSAQNCNPGEAWTLVMNSSGDRPSDGWMEVFDSSAEELASHLSGCNNLHDCLTDAEFDADDICYGQVMICAYYVGKNVAQETKEKFEVDIVTK